jgi:hypothetical protein
VILNQGYEWHNVRYQISRRISYDVDLCFDVTPTKELLAPGTALYRLDFPVVFGFFMKVWWMKEAAFQRIFDKADSSSSLRREWQSQLAMSKPTKGPQGQLGGRRGEATARTQVLVIETTQPVYAWVGVASPLFQRAGGEEQVYLPNLAHGSGPNHSEYARLLRTYTLPAG